MTSIFSKAKLYGILDTAYTAPEAWPVLLPKLIRGGVQIVQVRAKDLKPDEIVAHTLKIKPLLKEACVPLIMNDFPELVPLVGADGCHVGQDDMTVAEARKLTGRATIVGKSTHSLEQAIAAEAEGADYIGVGPIFSTPTKPTYTAVGLELIKGVSERVKIPQFCIGGIKLENLPQVVSSGAKGVVIVSGLLTADDPEPYARSVRNLLDS